MAPAPASLVAIRYHRGSLELLEQRGLPLTSEWVAIEGPDACWRAIKDMTVRGAPAIAIAAALSLAAQWLLNIKKVQTWYFWIAADAIYVPLYFAKDLWLTAIVYSIFLGLCVAGLRSWRAAYQGDAVVLGSVTPVPV